MSNIWFHPYMPPFDMGNNLLLIQLWRHQAIILSCQDIDWRLNLRQACGNVFTRPVFKPCVPGRGRRADDIFNSLGQDRVKQSTEG
jgi:hypothetical protein